ncbi:MAG: nuclease-related domain-containing protein, partial [Steroidobacteraceae bacterium]
FNLDHVVISSKGVFLIETKTVSKPRGIAKNLFDGEKLSVNGMEPDRNPILQAQAEASWLGQLLNESTGRHFPIKPVVVYPGWWIERANKKAPNLVWVLEPKALPKWIEQAPILLKPDEVALAAFHLSRYVRGFETVN